MKRRLNTRSGIAAAGVLLVLAGCTSQPGAPPVTPTAAATTTAKPATVPEKPPDAPIEPPAVADGELARGVWTNDQNMAQHSEDGADGGKTYVVRSMCVSDDPDATYTVTVTMDGLFSSASTTDCTGTPARNSLGPAEDGAIVQVMVDVTGDGTSASAYAVVVPEP